MESGTLMEKQAGREVARQEPTRGALQFRPVVDILELGDELRVLADVPGAKAEDIDINFEKGVLTIHARVQPRQSGDVNYLLREYGVGDFHRVFEVSESIDAERITAEHADGVLVLHLPKAEKARARRIEVRS
ncbi:MAG: Hsp20/alpha crystallin family protein [Gemmatimonadales bacterium]|jgi:HSP20 family molecular chaperone IbpA